MEWCCIPNDRWLDILEYGEIAADLAKDVPALLADVRLRLAFERALFLVGEAAAGLPAQERRAVQQPWSQIVGLRNVLAHKYEALRTTDLVEIARQFLPGLLKAVQRYVGARGH